MAAAASASSDNPNSISKTNSAIPFISKDTLHEHIDTIITSLLTTKQLSHIPNELSINIINIIVGSFVCKQDFDNPDQNTPRNHEYPAFVHNLLAKPGSQLSPAFLEHIQQSRITKVNFNQYMFLIDPMYGREEYSVPYGLVSAHPSIMYNPIISNSGFIQHDELLHIPVEYNSFLEACIVPYDIEELHVLKMINQFQSLVAPNNSLLINIMDCTSNILRKMWMQNNEPNIYLAMPDCLARDNATMYMPVITYTTQDKYDNHDFNKGAWSGCGCRWINWNLDKDNAPVFQLFSPNTYQFLINNCKRQTLETYFIPISKMLGRMRVSIEYNLKNGITFRFNKMTFQDFKDLWQNHHSEFSQLFISFMDGYFKWNYCKFIEILLADYANTEELSMQTILLQYLSTHLKMLKTLFPIEAIPDYTDDDRHMQTVINDYLHINNIH